MTHVLINLLSNAFKYSSPDQLVEIRGRVIADELEVLVVDRGIGVPRKTSIGCLTSSIGLPEFGEATALALGSPFARRLLKPTTAGSACGEIR